MPVRVPAGLLLMAGALPSGVLAAEAGSFAAPAAATLSSSGAGSLLQVTLALGVVVAAVFGAAWLMQRLRLAGGAGSGSLRVVTALSLGAKERVVVVQVGGEQLLLGVAPGRVTRLHVLPAPVDRQVNASEPAVEVPASFKSVLRRSLGL